jgi:hypothetical protein
MEQHGPKYGDAHMQMEMTMTKFQSIAARLMVLAAIILGLSFMCAPRAEAAPAECYYWTGTAFIACSPTNPLPVTISGGSGGNVTIVGPLGNSAPGSSVGVTLDSTIESAPGTPPTNAQSITIQGNASGIPVPVVGGVVAGTSIGGLQWSPVAGSDGTDVRPIKTDSSGDVIVEPGNTANTTPWLVWPQAATAGGATPVSILSANSTNATNVKSSAGTLYHISVQNDSTSSLAYIIFFNSSSTPTCTGTPYYGPILIPYVGSTNNNGSGVIEDIAIGLNFSTGISYCLTTAPGGTGSVAANQVSGGLGYK